jgi:hypothetical protein
MTHPITKNHQGCRAPRIESDIEEEMAKGRQGKVDKVDAVMDALKVSYWARYTYLQVRLGCGSLQGFT